MASIKNLKSKGRAQTLSVIGDGLSYAYEVRKLNARGNTRSHIVRPLRVIRAAYKQALETWDRALRASPEWALYPYAAEARYRTALIAAAAGKGHLVRRLAD